MLRNMLTVWFPYGVHMVHVWMIEIKSRVEDMMSEHMYMAY